MAAKYLVIPALLLLAFSRAQAANLAIDSLSGPVTQNEINAFKTYMATQVPPQTPFGALSGTNGDHNEWADAGGGNILEAQGLMYEITGDVSILTNMIGWADICVSQRNDLMSAANGGQRVMWTGNINKVWCPNETNSASVGYAGGENGDTKAHIALCALEILNSPSLWNLTVPDGNPFGYGVTYFQRATNYIGKCDDGNLDYDLKYFVTSGNLIRNPVNWPSGYHTMEANNIQMMLDGSWERLAQCHEILGDNPSLLARYDAAVNGSANECLAGMSHAYTARGATVYTWYYYPYNTANIENVGHAAYDMVGMYREFFRGLDGEANPYGFPRSSVVPFANSLVDVMNTATNTFSGNVDGTGTTQNYMQAQWLLLADWNPAAYDVVATADYASGRYKTTILMDATMLWIKNRRYLGFSISAAPASQVVTAGAGMAFTVPVAPLAGFTNVVNLTVTGLPANAGAAFSTASVNLAAINTAATNVTLSITTSNTTLPGTYVLAIVGTSGGVAHTNNVSLTIGNFGLSASPPAQTVFTGATNVTYTATVATNAGFSGAVAFGVSGLPPNSSAVFSPASVPGAGSATLTVTTSNNTPAGAYTLAISGTNGGAVASASVGLTIASSTAGQLTWNGGSAVDNNWTDPTNWSGAGIAPGDTLLFSGSNRLASTNDTAASTTYSNLVFQPGAGAFVLAGNPVTLVGSVTNNSTSTATVNLGLNFSANAAFNGAAGTLIIGGGLTNRLGAAGSTTLTLGGSGILTNLLNSVSSPGGTNALLLNDSAANWTLADNSTSALMTVPWAFEVNNGTFNFGTASSAPALNSTSVNGTPSDNQIGAVTGGTGTFNMANGTLTTTARWNTATVNNSIGVLNQTGGTMNIGSQFQGANGSNPGEVSMVNVGGGTMNIGGGTGPFFVASRGTGTLTVSGTGTVNCGKLDISRNANGNSVSTAGTVNLNGGTLMVTSVTNLSANQQLGGSPTAAFNFNGGTLMARAGAAAVFFQGSTVTPVTPITTTVKSGGAIIDDGGNAITVGEILRHDTSLDPDADGGLTKHNTGTLTLTAAATYNGGTLVSAGTLALVGAGSISASGTITVSSGATLDASSRSDGTLTLTSGQTLTGKGTVKGNVIVSSGATLAPGGLIGTLAFNNNLTLNGGSTTFIEISKSSPGTNDAAQVSGSVSLNGTLVITNIGAVAFAAGDSFKFFSASGWSGGFTNVLPVVPQPGLRWDTSALNTSGVLKVTAAPQPVIGAAGPGASLVLTASNGTFGEPCRILASTNPALPVSNWTAIATNIFDNSGGCVFTNTSTTSPQRFYLLQLQ